MRLAWFRPSLIEHARPFDDTASLIAELRSAHEIAVVTAEGAHDFVWTHFRTPFDLCVFELDDSTSHDFMWPYLLQYSGVLLLRTLTVHDSRAMALSREGRLADYAAEFVFNEGRSPLRSGASAYLGRGRPMLRAPLVASRIAVVPHRGVALALQDQYPEARVAYAPLGVREVQASVTVQAAQDSPTTFGVLSPDHLDVIHRALARAHERGASATLMIDAPVERMLQEADVILGLQWPSHGEPQTLALAAMSAGKPLVVLDTQATSDWPALDPQTWQPRGLVAEVPIVVSIDVRDEEHSLAVAIHRLAGDAPLRATLGRAAHDWWHAHASVSCAADAWLRILNEAAALAPPTRPPDWPVHLTADGTERARAILEEVGGTVDFLYVRSQA